jgi:hypothetical protein
VEHSLSKKQEEIENLLQHFRQRNEQYEHLLNESIMVNNRIHKKKIEKIEKIKEIEKEKFKKRLNFFLKKSGIQAQNIEGMKFKTKSNKSNEKPPTQLKKKKSKSFFEVIKKSIMFGKSSDEEVSVKSTSIHKNESKEQELFVNYESEDQSYISSDNEIDKKIKEMQNPNTRKKYLEDRRMMEEISESSEKESNADSSDTKVKLMNLSRNFNKKQKISNIEHSLDPKFQFESQVIVQKTIGRLASKREAPKLNKDVFLTNKKEDGLMLSQLAPNIEISNRLNSKIF